MISPTGDLQQAVCDPECGTGTGSYEEKLCGREAMEVAMLNVSHFQQASKVDL